MNEGEVPPTEDPKKEAKALYYPPATKKDIGILRMNPCGHCKTLHTMEVHPLEFNVRKGNASYTHGASCKGRYPSRHYFLYFKDGSHPVLTPAEE